MLLVSLTGLRTATLLAGTTDARIAGQARVTIGQRSGMSATVALLRGAPVCHAARMKLNSGGPCGRALPAS